MYSNQYMHSNEYVWVACSNLSDHNTLGLVENPRGKTCHMGYTSKIVTICLVTMIMFLDNCLDWTDS